MGTLFNQNPRNMRRFHEADIMNEISLLKDLSKAMDITYDQVVDTCRMLELRRRNDLYVNNGDTFDEQMAGLGILLESFIDQFTGVTEAYFEELPLSKAVEKIADAIKHGLGSGKDAPAFLEAMAMQMGYTSGYSAGASLIDALYNLKKEH